MKSINQFATVGEAFICSMSNLKENRPEEVSCVLSILDCVHPEPGYRLGIYIEEPFRGTVTHRCHQSWFHCYQGEEMPIIKKPYDTMATPACKNENMLFLRCTFGLFEHLIVEPSEMGAWQAYLLSISKALLPFSGRLYYTKRELVFGKEQIIELYNSDPDEFPGLNDVNKDLSPNVSMVGKEALVSCCFWTDWGGLIQENVKLSFMDNKRVHIGDFYHETVYEYNCGIRY